MKAMKGTRKHLSIYIDPPVADALRSLSTKTRIPQQSLLREAVDDLLQKHGEPVVVRSRVGGRPSTKVLRANLKAGK